jgi:hypothetical protein
MISVNVPMPSGPGLTFHAPPTRLTQFEASLDGQMGNSAVSLRPWVLKPGSLKGPSSANVNVLAGLCRWFAVSSPQERRVVCLARVLPSEHRQSLPISRMQTDDSLSSAGQTWPDHVRPATPVPYAHLLKEHSYRIQPRQDSPTAAWQAQLCVIANEGGSLFPTVVDVV